MSSDDMFSESVGGSLNINLSPAGSFGSTPIDHSGVIGAAANTNVEASVASRDHACAICKKVLSTRSGLMRHTMLHKLNDFNARKPLEESIEASLPTVVEKVLKELKEEPAVSEMGAHKKELVDSLAANIDSSEMLVVTKTVSTPLIEYVLTRKKIMPSAQYEEALKRVNELLCKTEYCHDLKLKIFACVPNDLRRKPDNVMQRLVWRITLKFLYKIQEIVFRCMKEKHRLVYQQYTMAEREVEIFREHIGKILRAVFKFGMSSNNPTWHLRCKSLRERFIQSEDCIISDSQFLYSDWWEKKLITLSAPAFNIFLGLERITQNLLNNGTACTAQVVIVSLTNIENLYLLDYLRELSSGILTEDQALSFFEDLIKNVVALSGKLDAKRKLLTASKKQRTSNVSLRTNLKRNPTGPPSEAGVMQSQGPSTTQTQEKRAPARGGSKKRASNVANTLQPVASQDSPSQVSKGSCKEASPAPLVAGQSKRGSSVGRSSRSQSPKNKSASQEQNPAPSAKPAKPPRPAKATKTKSATPAKPAKPTTRAGKAAAKPTVTPPPRRSSSRNKSKKN